MCLDLARKYTKRVAETDICVYKHLMLSSDNQTLLTTYQLSTVVIGEAYESKIKVNKKLSIYSGADACDFITEGLHSFKSLKSAIEDAKLCAVFDSNGTYDSYKIVRCVIPQGSSYYIGKFANKIAYVSNKLIYTGVVGEFKNNKYVTVK